MKNLRSNKSTNNRNILQQTILILVSILFTMVTNAQVETFKPSEKNRPTENVNIILPGSSKPQSVEMEKIDGNFIFQGDMVMFPNESGAAGILKERRWPNGIIPYQIQSGHPFTATINQAIMEINEKTNLRLIPKTNQNRYVKIKFDADGGCWSNVGKRAYAVNEISLGNGCNNKGTIIHELLHTAGMFHEQTRTDRDQYIRIVKENIYANKMHNFEKYKCSYDGIDIGAYDYNSVMHYPAYTSDSKFAKDPSKPILETIPAGISIGQRSGLSEGDIKGINAMYPMSPLAKNQYDWTALNSNNPILRSGDYFGLQNTSISKMVKYNKRKYGINLGWSENLNLKNIKFVLQNNPKAELLNGDKVAIYIQGKGYLQYKKREYGINIVWSDTPAYQWELFSAAGKKIIAGKPFSIYNTVIGEFMIYCKRDYGINLKWIKDCNGESAVTPPTRKRPKPRAPNTGPVVQTSGKNNSKTGSRKTTSNVRDHRIKN